MTYQQPPAPPPPPPPTGQPRAAKGSRRKGWLIGAAVVIVLAIIGAATNSGSKKKPAADSTTAHHATTTSAHTTSGHATHTSAPPEQKFVNTIKQNATAASINATGLLVEVEAMGTGAVDASGLYQIASDAKTLHDHLFSWREELLGEADATDNDQLDFIDAENELKNAAGTVQTWTGNPNPSTTADLTSQVTQAIADWNASVTSLWTKAAAGKAPTIGLAS